MVSELWSPKINVVYRLTVKTYILTQEGYRGKGIDIRAHPSWTQFPPNVDLEAKVRTQRSFLLSDFQEITVQNSQFAFASDGSSYDWLIGNRSDELTPWIIYASSFSPSSRLFVHLSRYIVYFLDFFCSLAATGISVEDSVRVPLKFYLFITQLLRSVQLIKVI